MSLRGRFFVLYGGTLLATVLLTALCGPSAKAHHTPPRTGERIFVSWYGLTPSLDGHPMAFGRLYAPWAKTAAAPLDPGTTHPRYASGTVLRLTRPQVPTFWRPLVWATVTVTIRDTCPGCGRVLPGRIWLDLSPGAYRMLSPNLGNPGMLTDVFLEVITPP